MMKAVLTGHTRGLGLAIAENLLSRNIPVLGISRNSNTGLATRFSILLEQAALDLSDPGAVVGWLAGDTLQGFLRGCRSVLLINNAGIVQPVGPLGMQDPAMVARSVGLNVAAPLMLSSAVAAASRDAADRRIMHVSSGAARDAYPGWSVYCAAKAALDHHARAVALDQTAGLRICSLAPGVIDTDMQAEVRATPVEKFPLRERFEAMQRDGNLSSPGDCAAKLVAYLLSERYGEMPVADLRSLPA